MTQIEGLRHVFPERKLAVFVTPKCGSSSLAKWFLFQQDLMALHNAGRTLHGRDVHTNCNIFANATPYRLGREDFEKAIASGKQTEWRTVKFVRNPYLRMVSSFLQILTLMDNEVELTFREFVNLPRYYFSNTGVPYINTGEPHARLQATTMEVTGELVIDHVLPIEEGIEAGLEFMEKRYGLKDSGGQLFQSNKLAEKNPFTDSGLSGHPADIVFSAKSLAAGAPIPSPARFLDDETKACIRDRHRADFDVYGFDPGTGDLPAMADRAPPGVPSSDASRKRTLSFLHQKSWEEDYVFSPLAHEPFDEEALGSALQNEKAVMAKLQEMISSIDRNEKIVVYGAGERLLDLVLSTDLPSRNIVAVTDSNVSGIRFPSLIMDNLGWDIVLPECLQERFGVLEYDKILIASTSSAEEIKHMLKGRLYRIPDAKFVGLFD